MRFLIHTSFLCLVVTSIAGCCVSLNYLEQNFGVMNVYSILSNIHTDLEIGILKLQGRL
jgi:hypothetical protein